MSVCRGRTGEGGSCMAMEGLFGLRPIAEANMLRFLEMECGLSLLGKR